MDRLPEAAREKISVRRQHFLHDGHSIALFNLKRAGLEFRRSGESCRCGVLFPATLEAVMPLPAARLQGHSSTPDLGHLING